MKNAKVAITHDWLYGGGAERVVHQLHEIYPDAPIYTAYCSNEWRKRLNNKVVTGYLQRWPFSKLRRFTSVLQILWFRSLKLKDYDIIISSSGSGHAKQVKKSNSKQIHISYSHTPPHYLWAKYDEYMKNPGFGRFNGLVRIGLKTLLRPLRRSDYKAAQKVDVFMANSTHIQKMIKKYYKRDAEVVYPPVEIERFENNGKQQRDGFVIFGRHVRHKRFDLAIAACNEIQAKLVVVGEGPETGRLKAMAGPTVDFVGRPNDRQIVDYISKAEASIFCNEDDFGIVAVEAQAAGTPVIAYRAGGSQDTVVEGVTGEFFDKQTIPALIEKIKNFNPRLYSQHEIVKQAKRFSKENFRSNFKSVVDKSQEK